jgi:hypothetical protein
LGGRLYEFNSRSDIPEQAMMDHVQRPCPFLHS